MGGFLPDRSHGAAYLQIVTDNYKLHRNHAYISGTMTPGVENATFLQRATGQ